MAEWNLDNERNRGLTELNRVSCHIAEVEVHEQRNLCRVEGRFGKYGGYRKDILKVNLTERDALLVCNICEGIMREACLSNSGEQFCSCCREIPSVKSISLNRRIKVAQEPLIPLRNVQHPNTHQTSSFQEPLNLNPNIPLRKMINSLKCSCPLIERGCGWRGTLEYCEDHLAMCGYVRDKCSLECGELLQRNELKLHMDSCPYREVECGHCFRDFKFCEMPEHLKECPKMKVTCELCDEMMCREDVTQHLEQDCGMMEETCTLGCEMKITRDELKIHVINTCVQRKVSCEHCKEDFKFCDMPNHLDMCPIMEVSCEQNCGIVMLRENMTQHLEQDCVMMETCELGCGVRMTRDELKIHIINTCVQRKVSCEYCKEDSKFCDIPNHLKKCPKMKVLCELNCGIVVCREDMAQHVEQDCVEKEIECPFVKYQCEVISIQRKYLSQHLEEKRTEHLELKLTAMELKLNAMEDTVFKQCEGSNEIKQHVDESKQHRDESKQHRDESKQHVDESKQHRDESKQHVDESKQHRDESKQHRDESKQDMGEINQHRRYMDNQVVRINRMSEHITALCCIRKITMLDWKIENLSKFIQINHVPEPRNVSGYNINIHFLKEYIYVDTVCYYTSFSAKFLIRLYSTIKCKVVKEYNNCDSVTIDTRGHEKRTIARISKSDAEELSRTGSANKLILEMYVTKQ